MSKSTRIIIMLVIDTCFFALELGVGLTVGSLALMADAFHMVREGFRPNFGQELGANTDYG